MAGPASHSCPSCGDAVRLWGAAVLDCPSCGAPLAALAQAPARQVIEPTSTAEQALEAALACWSGHPVPRALLEPRRWTAPRLAYAAFYQVERMLTDASGREETIEAGPAVALTSVPLDTVPLDGLATRPRRPFDPLGLQRRGVVLDPTLEVAAAVPVRGGRQVVDERVTIVYLPLWLLRCRSGHGVYETVVDASSGAVVGGRAPLARTARLPGAIGVVYLMALLAASQPQAGWWYLKALFRLHEVAAIPLLLVSTAGLAWLVAWSWDRVRFRWELVRDGTAVRATAVNRPEVTAPEKVRDGILDLAAALTRLVRKAR